MVCFGVKETKLFSSLLLLEVEKWSGELALGADTTRKMIRG